MRASLAAIGLLLLASALGCHRLRGAGDLRIHSFIVDRDVISEVPTGTVTFEFVSQPPGIDPRDVRFVFTSRAISGEQIVDWDTIASRDFVWRDPPGRYHTFSETDPSSEPPLGRRMRVKIPLDLVERIEEVWVVRVEGHDIDQPIPLRVEAYWGSVRQDFRERDASALYDLEPTDRG